MKKITLITLVFFFMVSVSHAGSCDIESWSYSKVGNHIKIEGAATCESARLAIRVYNAETNDLIGVAQTFIRGYVFETYLMNKPTPSRMSIRYHIEPR